jgi:hypothetical protein
LFWCIMFDRKINWGKKKVFFFIKLKTNNSFFPCFLLLFPALRCLTRSSSYLLEKLDILCSQVTVRIHDCRLKDCRVTGQSCSRENLISIMWDNLKVTYVIYQVSRLYWNVSVNICLCIIMIKKTIHIFELEISWI